MAALEELSVVVNVTPGTYNPVGGTRVQLAWQRYSNSHRLSSSRAYPQQPAARRRSGRPVRHSVRVCPAACR